jgi:hypothetical protein
MGSNARDPEGQAVELTLIGLRRDGREFAAQIMLAPMVTTKGTHFLAIVRRK